MHYGKRLSIVLHDVSHSRQHLYCNKRDRDNFSQSEYLARRNSPTEGRSTSVYMYIYVRPTFFPVYILRIHRGTIDYTATSDSNCR